MHARILLTLILATHISHASPLGQVTELIKTADQLYRNGNYDEAISLYERADLLESPLAKERLSRMYKLGKGVSKNDDMSNRYINEAITIYKKHANDGDGDAQFNLGVIYQYQITPPNLQESYNWHLMAAKNNHKKSQFAVASILETGSTKQQIKRDYKEAMKWYEKSAEQGDSGSAYKLAYENRKDFDTALKWCMPVAKKQNDPFKSMCLEVINTTLTWNLISGKHKKKTIDAIRELANNNIVKHQISLAKMYKEGTILPKNLKESDRWSRMAFNTALTKAQKGDRHAQYELAYLYEIGIGSEIYLDQAELWLNESAKNGYKPAIRKLAEYNKQQ